MFQTGAQQVGASTTPGRRRTSRRDGSTSSQDGKLAFAAAGREGRRRSTSTSPIPPSRCRIARGRSRSDADGRCGWWRTSASPHAARRADLRDRAAAPRTSWSPARSTAHLFAATSGTDCDWIVKLIDVYPEKQPDPRRMRRVPAADARRRDARALPQELREARAGDAGRRWTSTRSICTGAITASARGTRSWCRCRAPGSR